VDAVRTELEEFRKKYSGTQLAKKNQRNFEELSVLGKPTPANWKIDKWFQGKGEVDFRSKKPILLVFWEEWCPHCKREVPKIQAIYEKNKSAGLSVIGLTKLSRSSTEEKVEALIKQNSITYPMAKESGELSSYFAVRGVPAAAVVKGGKVIWRGHPAIVTDA